MEGVQGGGGGRVEVEVEKEGGEGGKMSVNWNSRKMAIVRSFSVRTRSFTYITR